MTCLKEFPDSDITLLNRASAYVGLENDPSLPESFRKKYQLKADADFKKIIEVIDRKSKDLLGYREVLSRATAKEGMDFRREAYKDYQQALELYQKADDHPSKDKNELAEIQEAIKRLKLKCKR